MTVSHCQYTKEKEYQKQMMWYEYSQFWFFREINTSCTHTWHTAPMMSLCSCSDRWKKAFTWTPFSCLPYLFYLFNTVIFNSLPLSKKIHMNVRDKMTHTLCFIVILASFFYICTIKFHHSQVTCNVVLPRGFSTLNSQLYWVKNDGTTDSRERRV